MWGCHKCGHENDVDVPMFGEDAVCEKCGAVHETDWDYIDAYEGMMQSWVIGLKPNAND